MASTDVHQASGRIRIRFTIIIQGKKIRREKYAGNAAEGRILLRRLEELEDCARVGMASIDRIEDWVNQKWLTTE